MSAAEPIYFQVTICQNGWPPLPYYVKILIHEADPQSHCFLTCRPSSVRPHFSKQNIFQTKTMVATSETVGLAEWIIDDTCLVIKIYLGLYN